MIGKKAILLVSTGTTHKEAINSTIMNIKEHYENLFLNFDIKVSFTSKHLIKLLYQREGIKINTVEEALDKLANKGYDEVIVQSLHILPGIGFHDMLKSITSLINKDTFKKITLGRPLLSYMGEGKDYPNDYIILAQALKKSLSNDKISVFVGHGSYHPSNSSYACLQNVFNNQEVRNVYIGTLSGYPSIDLIIKELKNDVYKEVILAPFLLVSGTHALRDIASDATHSWKSKLEKEGFDVKVDLKSLGDRRDVVEIFTEHTLSAKEIPAYF